VRACACVCVCARACVCVQKCCHTEETSCFPIFLIYFVLKPVYTEKWWDQILSSLFANLYDWTHIPQNPDSPRKQSAWPSHLIFFFQSYGWFWLEYQCFVLTLFPWTLASLPVIINIMNFSSTVAKGLCKCSVLFLLSSEKLWMNLVAAHHMPDF